MGSKEQRILAFRCLFALSLWVLAFGLFREPLTQIFWPRVSDTAQELGLPLPDSGPRRGFMMQINSTPSGAAFFVDGTERGHTPALANVACRQGDSVELRVVKEGFAEYHRTVECREGGRLQVRARLEP